MPWRSTWVLGLPWLVACGGGATTTRAQGPTESSAADGGVSLPATPGATASDAGMASDDSKDQAKKGATPCPDDMAHVSRDYCPDIERRCEKSEYDKPNRITICHRFDPQLNRCNAPRVALDFCIDRYEYPNRAGARPPVMLDFYEASKLCAEAGKRLCYESEWTAACEGPDETPFPYGWERSPQACNIDNAWVSPSLAKLYSPKPEIRDAELRRLDRSVPSGARPGCVSGFGVYDLTGNVDEWTRADRDRETQRGRFAALKGGAWGHVRNACRPVTKSHAPEFSYYFVSFRCCRDATP